MAQNEVKIEIHKIIDQLPDQISGEVLEYLKTLLDKSSHNMKMAKTLSEIISEDNNLLKRLAQ